MSYCNSFQLEMYGVAVNEITLLSTDPVVRELDDKAINMTVPFVNELPLNPLDISLVQQSPNQQLVKAETMQTFQHYFPDATFADRPQKCNDSNTVSMCSCDNLECQNRTLQYFSRFS